MRGFTLIELMVTIAIMITMTTLLLYNYPESAIRITLINSIHSVALLVREAQVRGSAIDSVNSSLGGYGVKIAIPANSNTLSTAILFGDTVSGSLSPYGLPIGNGLFETVPINETKSTLTLPVNYNITKICVGQGTSTCSVLPGSYVIISFMRPSPLPNIYFNGSQTINYSKACIEMQSPRAPSVGHIRSVEVYSSGMIRTALAGCI